MTVAVAQMVQADWLLRDDLETVSLDNPADANFDTISSLHAKSGPLDWRTLAAGDPVGTESVDNQWTFSAAEVVVTDPDTHVVSQVIPQQGWTITDSSGTVWTIISVQSESFGNETALYHCVGRMQYEESDG
jgi:hypothetical protein